MATRGYASPYHVASGTANEQVTTSAAMLHGANFNESAGTAGEAVIRVFDGTDNTGTLVGVIHLAGDESGTFAPASPVRCPNGIFIERVTGTSEGSVWYEED